MTDLKVLIIDDDEDIIHTIKSELQEDGPWIVHACQFQCVKHHIEQIRPDLLVLDLVEGSDAESRSTGNESFETIRRFWFCPVVVYSAFPENQEIYTPTGEDN